MRSVYSTCWKQMVVRASGLGAAAIAALALTLIGASPAAAVLASFNTSGDGFTATNLETLPLLPFSEPPTPFLFAGDPTFFPSVDVGVSGSGMFDICILPGGSNICQPDTTTVDGTGPYSVLVTFNVSVLSAAAQAAIDGPFTIFMTILDTDPSQGGYAASEVGIELNPTAPTNLDTSMVPGFEFDGTFNPFVRVQDRSDSSFVFDFIGWTVEDQGSVSFRYEVLTDSDGRPTPGFAAGAIPLAIPEPGTALLMGLGLAGLASAARRSQPSREVA